MDRSTDWGDFSSRYLAQLARKLRRGNVKTYQRSLAAALGTPNSAPDALFGLHYLLDSQHIAKAVKQLNDVGAPEIVIFDARYSLRTILSDWRKKLNMVVEVSFINSWERLPANNATDGRRAYRLSTSARSVAGAIEQIECTLVNAAGGRAHTNGRRLAQAERSRGMALPAAVFDRNESHGHSLTRAVASLLRTGNSGGG